MQVLKSILKDSKEYYEKEKKLLEKELDSLPKGNIKERQIGNNIYFYLQYREGKKVKQDYLGKSEPENLIKKIERRKILLSELKIVEESIKLLSKMK